MSSTDILIHLGQEAVYRVGPPAEPTNRSTGRAVMSPGVFCVRPETPAAKVGKASLRTDLLAAGAGAAKEQRVRADQDKREVTMSLSISDSNLEFFSLPA